MNNIQINLCRVLVLPSVYVFTASLLTVASNRDWCPQLRVHTSSPTPPHVLHRVALLFAIQISLDFIIDHTSLPIEVRPCSIPRMLVAAFVLDTYQYWAHRIVHAVPRLYRHIHSKHHEFKKPLAWAALYNTITESILIDAASLTVAQLATRLSTLETLILGSIATAKTVCDHSGYSIWFGNNAAYHARHHAFHNCNYEAPFFTIWDDVMQTRTKC